MLRNYKIFPSKKSHPMLHSKFFRGLFLFYFVSVFFIDFRNVRSETGGSSWERRRLEYDAGVVVDLNSKMGAMANLCLSMALTDFYDRHPDFETRLSLQTWDLHHGVLAANSSEYLLPQRSAEPLLAIKLDESSSPSQSPYLINMAIYDFSRLAKATIATVERFQWREVILIYEDMELGNAIVPYLMTALEKTDIRVSHKSAIPTSAEGFEILQELKVLMAMRSKVFVVHMTTNLVSRLFAVAKKAGMAIEGYSWVVTDALSNFVDSMDPTALSSMKGVIGIRPYVPKTRALKNFQTRYTKLSLMKQKSEASELNLLGLWSYDAIWALAMTAEKIGAVNSSVSKDVKTKTSSDTQILEEVLSTGFRGISGKFDLVKGQLQPWVFEIFNLTGNGEKTIGYWTPGDEGISSHLGLKQLKSIKPGNVRRKLDEFGMPEIKGIWRIGVPNKTGFPEFVNVLPGDNDNELPGFSIEVFSAVWKALALPPGTTYEFVNVNGTYDELCCQVKDNKIDAAVGDISIVASRTNCADFTLPYLESGVSMLIKVGHEGPKDMWIFTRPLSWDLWLTIVLICIFIGIVVRVLDRRENSDISNGSRRKQLSTILMFPCLSVALPQRDMVASNCSRLVLILWIFLAFILMQSYTANLTSILTVNQLQPAIPTLKELRKYNVGYQNHSFVKDFLINQLKFKEILLKPYDSVEDYQEALSKGSDNGGVAAIFDEIPFIKIFLAEYTNDYMMVGPTYRTDGLGFAFPIGSPIVANFSREILNFTQGNYMSSIEKKYFGKVTIDQDDTGSTSSRTPSLTTKSFAGLFMIIGIIVLLVLVVSENNILGRLVQRCMLGNSDFVSESRVEPIVEITVTNNVEENNNQESHNQDGHVITNSEECREEVIMEEHSS